VDLRALRSIVRTAEAPLREPVKPRSPEEEKLAAIWTEVLKNECIDVNASFFELGGHSLLATQIISRIRDAFRVQLPLVSFLEKPTIAAVAAKLRDCPPIQSEEEELAQLLAELEGLSDEEAERLLAAEIENGKD
jgi:acyl carrier protein